MRATHAVATARHPAMDHLPVGTQRAVADAGRQRGRERRGEGAQIAAIRGGNGGSGGGGRRWGRMGDHQPRGKGQGVERWRMRLYESEQRDG